MVLNPKTRNSTLRQGAPFFGAALLWLIVGTLLSTLLSPSEARSRALAWWFGIFIFSILDLATLAGLVGALLLGPPQGDRARWVIRVGFLGALKLGLLLGAALLLMGNRGIPSPSLLSGLGTLIVVPLLGGGLWSFIPAGGPQDRGRE